MSGVVFLLGLCTDPVWAVLYCSIPCTKYGSSVEGDPTWFGRLLDGVSVSCMSFLPSLVRYFKSDITVSRVIHAYISIM